METKMDEKTDIQEICNTINELNNMLISMKLSSKEIKTFVRTNLKNEAKELKKQFYREFEKIPDTNVLKLETTMLLQKIGVLPQYKVPIVDNGTLVYNSCSEEDEEEEDEDEDEGDENEFVEGDVSSSALRAGNEDDLNKSIIKLHVSRSGTAGSDDEGESVKEETEV